MAGFRGRGHSFTGEEVAVQVAGDVAVLVPRVEHHEVLLRREEEEALVHLAAVVDHVLQLFGHDRVLVPLQGCTEQ